MNLHVERSNRLAGLLGESLEADREAQAMAGDGQIAIFLAIRSARRIEMVAERVQSEAIEFVDHGSHTNRAGCQHS